MRYIFFLWGCLVSAFIFPAIALAACTQTIKSISPAVTDVPNDLGGMLSKAWHVGSVVWQCKNVGNYNAFANDISIGGVPSGEKVTFEGVSYKLYRTNVDDVFYFGYVSIYSAKNGVVRPYPFDSVPYTVSSSSFLQNDFNWNAEIKVRFYSTSKSMAAGRRNVSGVDVVSGTFYNTWGNSSMPSIPWSMTFSPFTFLAKGPTCKLTTPSEVNLKQLSVYKFSAPGTTVEAASFPLSVVCSANIPAYKVSYAMQDVNNSLNTSTNLTLANGVSDASGLALQILDAGTPIKFSPSSSGVMGILSGGAVSKFLSVQYIKTEPRITPGTVRAGVTVTLSYE